MRTPKQPITRIRPIAKAMPGGRRMRITRIAPLARAVPSGRTAPIPRALPRAPILARQRRARREQQARQGAALIAAGGAGAVLAFLLDPANGRRRRHLVRDRTLAAGRRGARRTFRRADYTAGQVRGAAHRAHAAVDRPRHDYDDVTLARKVESEIFRPAGAPKGSVDVNVHDGIVELRGQVGSPEQIAQLGDAAVHVDGVVRVENLLHTPGFPPKHSPPSSPAEVRARATGR